jgi:hypothetical protein
MNKQFFESLMDKNNPEEKAEQECQSVHVLTNDCQLYQLETL